MPDRKTSPEYYLLTMTALVNACIKKSNREPVMSLNEDDVFKGLEELRHTQLSYKSSEGVRAVRYCHNIPSVHKLTEEEQSLIALFARSRRVIYSFGVIISQFFIGFNIFLPWSNFDKETEPKEVKAPDYRYYIRLKVSEI
jgi:Protein of unknown function, DUF480